MLASGPLIRINGDRFDWQVKAAILHTLGLLIGKAGPGLKPFVPQLQTTFLKCLSDQVTRPAIRACPVSLSLSGLLRKWSCIWKVKYCMSSCRHVKSARALLGILGSSQR